MRFAEHFLSAVNSRVSLIISLLAGLLYVGDAAQAQNPPQTAPVAAGQSGTALGPKPTLALTIVSTGKLGNFTLSNDNGDSQFIATQVSGTPVSGGAQSLKVARKMTTVTMAMPAGFAVSSIICRTPAGGYQATPDKATVVLDEVATREGGVIACTFSVAWQPTLTLTINSRCSICSGARNACTSRSPARWISSLDFALV